MIPCPGEENGGCRADEDVNMGRPVKFLIVVSPSYKHLVLRYFPQKQKAFILEETATQCRSPLVSFHVHHFSSKPMYKTTERTNSVKIEGALIRKYKGETGQSEGNRTRHWGECDRNTVYTCMIYVFDC